VDQNLRFQQNLLQYSVAVVVLQVVENKLAAYLPLVLRLLRMLEKVRPGEMFLVDSES
jgi:hypothetical protein